MIGQQPNRIARAAREALNHPASVAGALALVLVAGIPGIAQTAGIEIHGGIVGPITNDAALDYLWIDLGAVVNGDVTNTQTGAIGLETPGWRGLAVQDSVVTAGIRNEGTIEAKWDGIGVEEGDLMGGVTNAGRIRALGGEGIRVDQGFQRWGGTVGTLSGGISNSGIIEANRNGIYVVDGFFTGGISNSGRIEAGSAGIYRAAGGLGAFDRVGATLKGGIGNSGAIQAGLWGVSVSGSMADGINNSGSIEVSGIPPPGLENVDNPAWGIIVQSSQSPWSGGFGGGIANSGTITSAGGGIGVFSSRSFWGGITNSGRIQSQGMGIYYVERDDLAPGSFDGGISNNGTIASSAADGIVVDSKTFYGAIVNSGLIEAAGVGVRVASNIQGGIVNTGTIRGGEAAIDTTAATGPTVINLNGGAIFGNIALSPAFADTISAAAGTMQGDILATGPRDDRVNFILDGLSFTMNGNIEGVDRVFVDPGTLYLNGNIIGVNSLILDANTTLVLGSTATASPTSFVQDPTAVLSYTIAADGSHGTVNAGSVTLAGTLSLPMPPGLPQPNGLEVYSNLMTWTNRTGAFSALDMDTGSIFLTSSPVYGPTSLSVEIGRLPFNRVPAGLSGNRYAVATGLENAYPVAYANADAQSVAFYTPIFGYSEKQYAQFLGAVSGSTYANALQATVLSAQLVNAVVNQRLNGAAGSFGTTPLDRDRPATAVGARSAWATVLGNWANGDGDANAPGFSQNTGGLALGLDYRLSAQTLVGILASYLTDRIDFDNNSDSDVTTWQIGAYGQHDADRWYANGLVTVGWNDYDSKRRIVFTGVTETAKGSNEGNTYVLYAEAGYKLPLGDLNLKPLFGLGYVNGDTTAFTESGGGVYRLRVQGASAESFTGNLGVRAALGRKTANGTLVTGEAHAIWQHEFLDDQQSVGASFAVLPGSGFTVEGTRFARDSAVLGVSVKARVASNTEVFLNYDAKLSSDYTANALFAGVRMDW